MDDTRWAQKAILSRGPQLSIYTGERTPGKPIFLPAMYGGEITPVTHLWGHLSWVITPVIHLYAGGGPLPGCPSIRGVIALTLGQEDVSLVFFCFSSSSFLRLLYVNYSLWLTCQLEKHYYSIFVSLYLPFIGATGLYPALHIIGPFHSSVSGGRNVSLPRPRRQRMWTWPSWRRPRTWWRWGGTEAGKPKKMDGRSILLGEILWDESWNNDICICQYVYIYIYRSF